MTGRVFEIREFTLQDGPGVRTTVFFKGCPLRCAWCHNPESISYKPQTALFSEKCIGCGRCVDVCWHEGIEIRDRKAFKTDRCIGCGYCFQVCPTQALYVDKKSILTSAFEEAGIRRGNQ